MFSRHRPSSSLFFAVLFSLFSFCGCNSPAPGELSGDEKQEVERLLNSFSGNLKKLDTAAYLDLFVDSARFFRREGKEMILFETARLMEPPDNHSFGYEVGEYALDSVTEEFVFLQFPMTATRKQAKSGKVFSNPISVILLRKPPMRFVDISGDWIGLTWKIDTEKRAERAQEALFDGDGRLNFEAVERIGDSVKGNFERVAFLTRVEEKNRLYVGKDGYESMGWQPDSWQPKGKVALADESGKLLSKWYDEIGSFGTLADGFAEVRLNGKWGLIDADGKELLAPEHDRLFPASSAKYVVVMQRKGQFAGVLPGGSLKLLEAQPTIKEIIGAYRFDPILQPSPDVYPAHGLLAFTPSGGNTYMEYVIPPGLFREMGIAPVAIPVKTHDSGEISAISVENMMEPASGISGMISKLEEWSYGPREDFHSETFTATTYDAKMKLIARVELMKSGGDQLDGRYCDVQVFNLLGKDTIEVKYNYADNGLTRQSTEYKYYHIDSSGRINILPGKIPSYPFLSLIKMDKSHLQGCWVAEIPEKEWTKQRDEYSEGPWGEYWVTSHLPVSEIESMIAQLESGANLNEFEVYNLAFLKGYLPDFRANERAWLGRKREMVHGW